MSNFLDRSFEQIPSDPMEHRQIKQRAFTAALGGVALGLPTLVKIWALVVREKIFGTTNTEHEGVFIPNEQGGSGYVLPHPEDEGR